MRERLENITDNMSEFARKTNPDLYTPRDARYALSKIEDKSYSLGSEKINPEDQIDQAKIWSLTPRTLEKVKEIINDAGHVHILSFIMGTYHMNSQKMRMNDVSASDPIMIPLMAVGAIEAYGAPLLRGLYFLGRRGWWRHESIHARHHHQMADFLETRDERRRTINGRHSSYHLKEAGLTIHEAGIEELLTRWQSLKEARGVREKVTATAALVFYLEYAPFTGIRNMFIDGKEKIGETVENGMLEAAVKLTGAAGVVALPIFSDMQWDWTKEIGETLANHLPVSKDRIESAEWRGVVYTDIALLSALFSSSRKGAFEENYDWGERIPTKDYKFPYVYSPLASLTRSIGFLRYLSKVWSQMPNYRLIESPRGAETVKREIDERLASKMDDKQRNFTMDVVDDALRLAQARSRSAFPQEVYIKGLFTPALYLRLRELYS